MADRLSALSAAFLTAEDVDPEASLAIASCAVLDGPAPSTHDVVALIAERLELAPRYRQRVLRTPLDLRAPRWVDVPDLDVADHVQRLALPAPGGEVQLDELVGWVMGGRMDRGRPLWDVWVVEGLEAGRWALLCRVHHALADGVSGTALMRVVYDGLELAAAAPPTTPHSRLARAERVIEGAATTATRALTGGLTLGAALLPTHAGSLVGRLGATRGYAWSRVGIGASAAARHHLGVTLNDLALGSVAGGYRELLLDRDDDPADSTVRSLVPVSVWPAADTDAPDNKITLMTAMLPVEVADPVERVLEMHRRIADLREAGEPQAGLALLRLAAWTPYAAVRRATSLGLRLPQLQIATVTTNVPGPRSPVTCLGRPVRALLPYVPIADRVRTGVAMLSYCDSFTFGVTSDLDHVADAQLLADATVGAWNEVVATVP